MSLLLCHECYSWVEPRANHCPDCLALLDLLTPDPTVRQLRGTFGRMLCLVGEVQVRRKRLPGRGHLYATSTGLFFVPHDVEREPQVIEGPSSSSSLLWSMASLVWSPLMLLMPLVRPRHRVQHVSVYRPRFVVRDETTELAEMIMESPGAFFVPRRTIRLIRAGRMGCRIERFPGSTLHLKPVGLDGDFQSRLESLTEHDPWRDVPLHR